MDADILEQLYRAHYTAAYFYCLTLCGQEALAQDMVADAFVKAYLSLPNDVPSFRWWLLRVCRNMWLDHLRREKHLAGSEPLDFLSDPVTPENRYIQQEQYRFLWRCIAGLPPGERELLTLHYFSGIPLKDISSLTGTSYTAVRKRMERLKEKLRHRMEEHGYGKL